MSRILVTGVNGFVGHHLARELFAQGYDVVGVGNESVLSAGLEGVVKEYVSCDLTKPEDVARIPFFSLSAVINLAGIADVGKSFNDPELYMDVNVGVLSVMCKQIEKLGLKKLRVVAISSGAVYASNQQMPLTEASRTDSGSSPYAASKIAMEKYALEFRAAGFNCVMARPFNHIGPGQLGGFLLPDLYKKLLASSDGTLRVGNLQTERDYTDVRDVTKAYTALATSQTLGYDTYNVCSGRSISGVQLLETLMVASQKTNTRVVLDDKLLRPSDSPILFGDSSRLQKDTGWSPTILFEKSVSDFVKWKSNS